MCGSLQQFAVILLLHVVLLAQTVELVQSFGIDKSSFTTKRYPTTPDSIRNSPTTPEKSTPTNRRDFLFAAGLTVSGVVAQQPLQPANAASGASASMELPSYIEFLMEKNAVADTDAFLYKGPDPQTQLKRLLEASKRLGDIPALAQDKKWSQVQGILTGPLGTLAQTLTAIAKESPPEVQAKAKKVKEDIFNISLAASKKNQADVVLNTNAAAASLDAFVRVAF